MNGTFDTLSYTRRLEAGGVPPAQAEAHAQALSEALRSQLATKADVQLAKIELGSKIDLFRAELDDKIDLLRTELDDKIGLVRTELNDKIDLFRTELNGKIDLFRTELDDKIELVRTELNAKIEAVRDELNANIKSECLKTRNEILAWIFGLFLAQNALMFAALSYFRH